MQMILLKGGFKISKSALYEMKFVFPKQTTWSGGLHCCVELYEHNFVIIQKKLINQMLTFLDNLVIGDIKINRQNSFSYKMSIRGLRTRQLLVREGPIVGYFHLRCTVQCPLVLKTRNIVLISHITCRATILLKIVNN